MASAFQPSFALGPNGHIVREVVVRKRFDVREFLDSPWLTYGDRATLFEHFLVEQMRGTPEGGAKVVTVLQVDRSGQQSYRQYDIRSLLS